MTIEKPLTVIVMPSATPSSYLLSEVSVFSPNYLSRCRHRGQCLRLCSRQKLFYTHALWCLQCTLAMSAYDIANSSCDLIANGPFFYMKDLVRCSSTSGSLSFVCRAYVLNTPTPRLTYKPSKLQFCSRQVDMSRIIYGYCGTIYDDCIEAICHLTESNNLTNTGEQRSLKW